MALLRHSNYLSGLAARFANPGSCADILGAVSHASAEDLPNLKARFALAFAQEEFANFDKAGRIWSGFADATIDRALVHAWQITAKRHKLKLPEGKPPGFFVLGLGKLGGMDLNFSSDVDLLAFYDAEILPVPTTKGQAYIASEVCKNLTQILQPRHAPDFVWRVDWRLRPESSGTGLAMSTTKAENFYFFRALPWHRLALMKARIVGGDNKSGDNFLAALEPFIWRRNLDFTMLDELAALKSRINDEHPGLESERQAPAPITPQAAGFNLKLGRGGIREIEFIANAQQLVHGGKRPALRTTNTRTALSQLREENLLPADVVKDLLESYAHFRTIENAVQMLRNDQTHIIPDEDHQAELLGLLKSPKNFNANIFERRKRVHDEFSKLFETTKIQSVSVDLSKVEESAKSIARSWASGFSNHGLTAAVCRNFQDLGTQLVARVQQQNRTDAFQTVDDFLKQLGRSEQYFTLLARHPNLLDTLVTPLLHSPHMIEILRQSPHIIDIFLSPAAATLEAQSAFVLSSPDYERRLEALRRFVNEQLFRAYTRFLDGESDAAALQARLTAIAERSLALSLRIVADDLDVNTLPMTVLGLGKMGTATMAPQSDLDLVFLFADDCDTDLSAQIVRRLRTTLMTKLREGIAYELDMRLRPSGRSGPPAVKLSAFRDHHMNRAHTWEHIALAPARIVAGDQTLGEHVMAIKSDILNHPRNRAAFIADASAMYERIRAERITQTQPDIWRCKLREGGLMQADFLLASYAVLGEKPPEGLEDTARDWRELQIWERLLGLKGQPLKATPSRFTAGTSPLLDADRIIGLEKTVTSAAKALFKPVSSETAPDPAPIIWEKP